MDYLVDFYCSIVDDYCELVGLDVIVLLEDEVVDGVLYVFILWFVDEVDLFDGVGFDVEVNCGV